jgi:hypothetical protein
LREREQTWALSFAFVSFNLNSGLTNGRSPAISLHRKTAYQDAIRTAISEITMRLPQPVSLAKQHAASLDFEDGAKLENAPETIEYYLKTCLTLLTSMLPFSITT